MPQKVLEEILKTISDDEKKMFDEHIDYRSIDKQNKWKHDLWNDVKGGTEKIFDDVYHSSTQYITEKKLDGKTDRESVRMMLEKVVLTSMENGGDIDARQAAQVFKATLAAKEFKSEDEIISTLMQHAKMYLGIEEEAIQQFMGQLQTGDKYIAFQAIRTFTDRLKDSIINHYLSKHAIKTFHNKERKFTAYVIQHIKDTYKKEPELYGKELLKSPDSIIAQLVRTKKSDYEEKLKDKISDYKPIEKKE